MLKFEQFTKTKLACCGLALTLGISAPIYAQEPEEPVEALSEHTASDFVGTYDGSSFETAMGMRINADGTFEWRLAVGSLDMRSAGEWTEKDGVVHFTTTPPPVSPEFRFLGLEEANHPKLVHVFREDGSFFTYAEAIVECANGARNYRFTAGSNAYLEGYEPEECDRPVSIVVKQSQYNVISQSIDLKQLDWKPGQIVRFEFIPNNIGVLDLTGMSSTLSDGVLTVDGPLGRETFRKLDANPQPKAAELNPAD